MVRNWMKRVLAVMLVLMMALPVAAMAEITPPTPVLASVGSDFNIYNGAVITVNLGYTGTISMGVPVKSYSSSSRKTVSVDAYGNIAALREGKAKITVTMVDKSRIKFTINVVDPLKPQSVSFLDGAQISIYAGMSYTLTPSLAPTTAVTTYTWKTNKKKIATVDASGTVHGVKAGKAKITVTTANKKKATITVNVMPNKVDGITNPPSTYDVITCSGNWQLWPKSMEIVGNDMVMEFYLLNNIGRVSKVDITSLFMYFPDGWEFNGYAYKQRVSCKRGAYKVFKVTFKGGAAGTEGWLLPSYNPTAINWEWKGTVWYR